MEVERTDFGTPPPIAWVEFAEGLYSGETLVTFYAEKLPVFHEQFRYLERIIQEVGIRIPRHDRSNFENRNVIYLEDKEFIVRAFKEHYLPRLTDLSLTWKESENQIFLRE